MRNGHHGARQRHDASIDVRQRHDASTSVRQRHDASIDVRQRHDAWPDAEAASPALELRSIELLLGGRRALDGADLTTSPGGWTCLVGANGSGKSTLLRVACGVRVPSAGVVRVAGRNVVDMSRRARARAVALVPQTPTLPTGMRVAQYVLLGRTPHCSIFAPPDARDHDAAAHAIDLLDVIGLVRRRLDTLSGGERQRVVLARAVAQGASLLLLDEPTTALDPGRQQQLLDLVAALRASTDLTVVSATHDLTLAAQHADHVVLLAQGRTVAAGTPNAVLREDCIAEHLGARVRVLLEDGRLVAVVPRRR